MKTTTSFPNEFQKCVEFHGHLCLGLAIGYSAAKAAQRALGITESRDEEIVAIVENDSCAVDAVQVVLGCTFGKGNLVFRDWGKQVFTILDRKTNRAVRISFKGPVPYSEERNALKLRIQSGEATDADKERLNVLVNNAIAQLIGPNFKDFFDVREVQIEPPSETIPVSTRACDECGELTVVSRLREKGDKLVCAQCANSGH